MDEITKELIKLRREQEEQATSMLADKLKLGYVDLLFYQIAPEVLKIIPKDQAIKHQMVAYLRIGKEVKVATARVVTQRERDWIKIYVQRLGYESEVLLCSASSLTAALSQYRRLSQASTLQATQTKNAAPADFSQIIKSVKDVAEQTQKASTSDLFNLILAGGVNTDASDIHIEPAETSTRLRFRIDGVLQDVAQLSLEQYAGLLSRIKILAGLKLDIKDKPQDGRFEYQLSGRTIDLRISTLPSSYGEALVLRLLLAGQELKTLAELEFPQMVLDKISEAMAKPHGMIINTGPTGSGKTTTLYAILVELNRPGVKIITIEDPIEYRLPGLDQTQVDSVSGYTYEIGLRGALRQDPDIIMIGEIRDPGTAKIALQAALTGHLVLTTLHANTASAALPRLLDMGVEAFLLAGSINLIVAQRLVRKICPACGGTGFLTTPDQPRSEPILASSSEAAGSTRSTDLPHTTGGAGTMPDRSPRVSSPGQGLAWPTGTSQQSNCPACQGTAYRGRTPIVEALVPTHEFNELIARKATVEEFEQKAKDLGMNTMYEAGLEKVQQGITTTEEVERVTRE